MLFKGILYHKLALYYLNTSSDIDVYIKIVNWTDKTTYNWQINGICAGIFVLNLVFYLTDDCCP